MFGIWGGVGVGLLWDCWGEGGLELRGVMEISVRVRSIYSAIMIQWCTTLYVMFNGLFNKI